MLPLGHMGITLTAIHALLHFIKIATLDYRVVLIGSLLPDLLDKSLEILLSNHTLSKSFGHSLLFLVLLYITGILIRSNQHKTMLKILWICSAIHDVFDLMWHFPNVLLWPISLPNLQKTPYESWGEIIHLYGFPIQLVFALEILGGGILLVFFIQLALDNKLAKLLKTGKL